MTMAALIALFLFVLLMSAITAFGYRRYVRPARVYDQLGEAALAAPSSLVDFSVPAEPSPLVKVLKLAGEKVPVSPEDASVSRRYLIAAGYRTEAAVAVFYGIKVIIAVALLLFAIVFHS